MARQSRVEIIYLYTLENKATKEYKVIEGHDLDEAREAFQMDNTLKFFDEWEILFCEDLFYFDGILIQ